MRLYNLNILLFTAVIIMGFYQCDCGKKIMNGAHVVSAHKARCSTYALQSRTVGGLGENGRTSISGGWGLQVLASREKKCARMSSHGHVEAELATVSSDCLSHSFPRLLIF